MDISISDFFVPLFTSAWLVAVLLGQSCFRLTQLEEGTLRNWTNLDLAMLPKRTTYMRMLW
jgi:hypothetical protein